MGAVADLLIKTITGFKGVSASDYCHLETVAKKGSKALLMTNGGFISAIDINGLNKVVGDREARDAHKAWVQIIDNIVRGGHILDFGFSQNGLESEQMIENFQRPLRNTANAVGLESDRLLNAEKERLKGLVRPEHGVYYIITPPNPEFAKEQAKKFKEMSEKTYEAFNNKIDAQQIDSSLVYSNDLLNSHDAMVETITRKLADGNYSFRRLDAREIAWAVKRDAGYEDPGNWTSWLWGDKARFRTTPEDAGNKPVKSLANWGGLPLGQQIHPMDITSTDTFGIARIGDYYVAPMLVELLPDGDQTFDELIKGLPNNIPFRYRGFISGQKSFTHTIQDVFAQATGLSKKWMPKNSLIAESFQYVGSLKEKNKTTANISLSIATWHTDKEHLKRNMSIIKARLADWGRTQVLPERGDLAEACLATIPGFCTTLFTPQTLDSTEAIARLVPMLQPATPFNASGFTPFRTESGRFWTFNPTSSELAAFIEIFIAPTGSGKSVAQNAVNRAANLRPGMKDLARHATIDIGISGKGTVKGLKASLPLQKRYQAAYERMTIREKHAFNPFDLHLGTTRPTPVDQGWLEDFIEMLATPKSQEVSTKMMAELVTEIIDLAYAKAFDKESAKIYSPGINKEVDEALSKYHESNDSNTWGMHKTWVKVSDFLFKRGEVRAATVAYRYVVPLITELTALAASEPSLKRFPAELIEEFDICISSATKRYPLLTQPTRVDFDSARYMVLDLNDVTQTQGSQQTAIMYALSAQMATREYWLNEDDLIQYKDDYREWAAQRIAEIREQPKGVTFEEFRRTDGLPKLRSMVNRWMAEGRKWGIRVQIVVQQPKHLDKEMMGHATMVNLMGSWNKEGMVELLEIFSLTQAEQDALMNGKVHGPGSMGSSFIMKYNLKKTGWGGQLLYLTKSVVELWDSTTTQEDMTIKERLEKIVKNIDKANEILCETFPGGSAKTVIEQRQKELSDMNITDIDVYTEQAEEAIRAYRLLNEAA